MSSREPKYWIFWKEKGSLVQVAGGITREETEFYLKMEKKRHKNAFMMSNRQIFQSNDCQAKGGKWDFKTMKCKGK